MRNPYAGGIGFLLCLAALAPFYAQAAEKFDESRGALLYQTHCIACHTDKVHWRENHLVKNWDSLVGQVNRWQSNAALGWEETDIRAVAGYLNTLYYHYPAGQETASSREATKQGR